MKAQLLVLFAAAVMLVLSGCSDHNKVMGPALNAEVVSNAVDQQPLEVLNDEDFAKSPRETPNVLAKIANVSESYIRMAGVGGNYGERAANQLFSSGDLSGEITRITEETFNSMSPNALRANYDVLLITYGTLLHLNADWNTRLLPYLESGGGIIWEDPLNLSDLQPAIIRGYSQSYGTWELTPVPGLTDGFSNDLGHSHYSFDSWDTSIFNQFLTIAGKTAGLYGVVPEGGRMVAISIDADYHAQKGESGYYNNLYYLLKNEILWVYQNSSAPSNHPPVANAGEDQTVAHVNGYANVILNGSGSGDSDEDTLTYTWSENGIQIATGVSVTVNLGIGAHTITLAVDDNNGGTATDEVVVTVTNSPPIAKAGEDQIVPHVDGFADVILDGSGSSDPNGDVLTYTWTENGIEIAQEVSPAMRFGIGTHTITLIVDDSRGGTDTDNVVVNVANSPPVADAGEDQVLPHEDGSADVTLDGSGSSDPDGDPLSYNWSEDDTEIADGVSPTVNIDIGTHEIILTVDDSHGGSDTDDVMVSVVNTPPVANAGEDQVVPHVNGFANVILDGSGSSDLDGDALTYTWTENGIEMATGVSPSVILGTGAHTITLTIDDNYGGLDSDEVTVNVVNSPPVADAGEDITMEGTGELTAVTLNGSGSYDSNGDDLAYSWSENGIEIGAVVSPIVNLEIGTYIFTLTVDDGNGGSDSDEVVVNVVDTTPPEINLNLSATEIWPPNRKLMLVASGISASDNYCDATLTVIVMSNEPADDTKNQNIAPEWDVVDNGDGTFDVYVRADKGRIYLITASAVDCAGNQKATSATVAFPENQKGNNKGK